MSDQPHVARMKDELTELETRMDRLYNFMNGDSPTFKGLPETKRLLMQCQLGAMRTYRDVLAARLKIELRDSITETKETLLREAAAATEGVAVPAEQA